LLRLYAATKGESKVRIGQVRQVRHWLSLQISRTDLIAYQAKLQEELALTYCYTFSHTILSLDHLLDFF
jgi:hypothetical protein